MLVPILMGTNMAKENPAETFLLPSFLQKREFIPGGTYKRYRKTFPNTLIA